MDNIVILLVFLFCNFAATADEMCSPPDSGVYANCSTVNEKMQCQCADTKLASFIYLSHKGDCEWNPEGTSDEALSNICKSRLETSCWSSFPISKVNCPEESEHVSRSLGHERNCICEMNCAPVTVTCKKLKGGEKEKIWSYNETVCYEKRSYSNVSLSPTLRVSYENDSYTFSCKDGYELASTVNNTTCSQGKLHPVPTCQLLSKDSLIDYSSGTIIGVVAGVLFFVALVAAIVFCVHRQRRRTTCTVRVQQAQGSNETPRPNSDYASIDPVWFNNSPNVNDVAEYQVIDLNSKKPRRCNASVEAYQVVDLTFKRGDRS